MSPAANRGGEIDATEPGVQPGSHRSAPSRAEILLMLVAMFGLHLWAVCRVKSFWVMISTWPDNPSYLILAGIIRNWHFPGGELPHHFWGFPYVIAGITRLFPLPGLLVIVGVSMLASLVTGILVHRLYGGWVAAAFVLINYEWIILSVEGSSEPLFMCLIFASFCAARSSRWNTAALLASLSTFVRPLGVFALIGFAVDLGWRKKYRQAALVALIGVVCGLIYFLPVKLILGNPFANFTGYSSDWKHPGWPLTYPFGSLIPAFVQTFHSGARWYTLLELAIWPVFAIVGLFKVWPPNVAPGLLERFRFEAIFASLYILFFLSYDYPGVLWYFSRFLIPVIPVLLYSMRAWIPQSRPLLWAGALLSAALSASAMVGFRNVFGFKLP